MPECFPNLLITHGQSQKRMVFPAGMALPLPDEAACLVLETHYKAPPLEEPRLKAKELLRQAGSLSDSSGLRVTFESRAELLRRGSALKYVQVLEVGPRIPQMLTLPPGRANHKVTSVCPGTCFSHAMQDANVPEIHIIGVAQHAHSAATAMFGEAFNMRTRMSVVFGAVPNHPEYRKRGEYFMPLRKPLRVTGDDV